MGAPDLKEPYAFTSPAEWWRCGAPDCVTWHVDKKRADNCPKRKRALRRDAFMKRIPV